MSAESSMYKKVVARPPDPCHSPEKYAPDDGDLQLLVNHWASKYWALVGWHLRIGFGDWRKLCAARTKLNRLAEVLGADAVGAVEAEAGENERGLLGYTASQFFLTCDHVGRRRVMTHTHQTGAGDWAETVTLIGYGGSVEMAHDLTMTFLAPTWTLEIPKMVWQAALYAANRTGWTLAGTMPDDVRMIWIDYETSGCWDYSAPLLESVTSNEARALADAVERGTAEVGEPGRFARIVELCRQTGGFVIV